MRAEELARNLAVLGARGDVPAAAPLAAVVVGREERQVVAWGVVRGEVGGEEEEARRGGEEACEVCRGFGCEDGAVGDGGWAGGDNAWVQ